MQTSETSPDYDDGAIVVGGRVFRPLYKHLLDNMPRDLVVEMARRRLAALDAGAAEGEPPPATFPPRTGAEEA